MEAKKLTNNSYMIIDKFKNRLGLVFEKPSGKFFYTYNNQDYSNIEDIAKSIGEELVYTEIAIFEQNKSKIEDYPAKHEIIFDEHIEMVNNKDVMVYKTREESKIYFCVGWWVIPSPKQDTYRVSLSPKVKTITTDCLGPFKDKFTAQAELNRVNNERIQKSG